MKYILTFNEKRNFYPTNINTGSYNITITDQNENECGEPPYIDNLEINNIFNSNKELSEIYITYDGEWFKSYDMAFSHSFRNLRKPIQKIKKNLGF